MSRPENQEYITSSKPAIDVILPGDTDTCWPDVNSIISKESSVV